MVTSLLSGSFWIQQFNFDIEGEVIFECGKS